MVENPELIAKKKPKKLEYIEKLLNYDQKETIIGKAKQILPGKKNKTRPHTISEWCEILGKQKTNPDTRKFLEKLVEKKVLTREKTRNGSKTYSLDKDKLTEIFYRSKYYNWHRDIFFKVINKEEPTKKIVTDI